MIKRLKRVFPRMRLLECGLTIFVAITLLSAILYLYMIVTHLVKQPVIATYYMVRNRKTSDGIDEYEPREMEDEKVDQKILLFLYANMFPYNQTQLEAKVMSFKSQILSRLSALELQRSNQLSQMAMKMNNTYDDVDRIGQKGYEVPRKSSLCEIPFRMIETNPTQAIQYPELFLPADEIKPTCALVANSDLMMGSILGVEIDNHDIVLRINDSPTFAHENDVGSKTDIRILNSEMILNESFHLTNLSMYYGNYKKYVWHPDYPCKYNTKNRSCHEREAQFFNKLRKIQDEMVFEEFDVIHAETVWHIWKLLDESTYSTIDKHPPSSAFIGLTLLLKMCSSVNVYGLVPSLRLNQKCNYDSIADNCFQFAHDSNQLSFTEIIYALKINEGNDYGLALKGKIKIPGC